MLDLQKILKNLGLTSAMSGTFAGRWLDNAGAQTLVSTSPVDGREIGKVQITGEREYESVVNAATETFVKWRSYPAPKRGEVVRQIAEEFRKHKSDLGQLISYEMGKILAEGEGEVQETIDIADFAVGLSRQLYGLTMHSERPEHRMYEQWHPLGNVAVITAFNFPNAVWAWNAMIGAVCGNSIVWKGSELTPYTSLATIQICARVAAAHGFPGLFTLVTGDGPTLGKKLAADRRFPLVSATGSCRMGCDVGQVVAARFGRSLLELGGNNALIVLADANLDLAMRAILFGAAGTTGQRCTSTRRVIVENKIKDQLIERLKRAFSQVRIGNPLENGTLIGPLVNQRAVEQYEAALKQIQAEGGQIICGGKKVSGLPSTLYVEPTLVLSKASMPVLQDEVFAPITHIIGVDSLEEAIAVNNGVPQGLSSAIFTDSLQSAERYLSVTGSDCGIANVNIGTSGAEIGGAFGGEKDTGGGREAGSDSWKAYMRRQTNTINWGKELPLAQGVRFE